MSILEGDLADIISDALQGADIPYTVIVRRTVTVDDTPWIPGSGTTTTVSHSCQGFVDVYKAHERDGTLIQANDVKIVVLAPTLSIDPNGADSVVARGETYSIVAAELDAAEATWTIQARR